MGGHRHPADGWKDGDLYGIPWMFAHWMRRDGWYVRSEVIWAKGRSFDEEGAGSCQPESCKDRPARSHEQVFLFTKSREYFYDIEAAKEKSSSNSHARAAAMRGDDGTLSLPLPEVAAERQGLAAPRRTPGVNPRCAEAGSGIKQNTSFSAAVHDLVASRNLRSVWSINPRPNPVGGHYAAFPEDLVEPMIRVGTSERGCCPACGSPWAREVERWRAVDGERRDDLGSARTGDRSHPQTAQGIGHYRITAESRTIGWNATCACAAVAPVPCVVLDPFGGTCTTAAVAIRLGRRAVCVDLSAKYLRELATRRTSNVQMELGGLR